MNKKNSFRDQLKETAAQKHKPKLNNARFKSYGAYIAVYDFELKDKEQEIWVGTPVLEVEQRKDNLAQVVFTRRTNKEINDMDIVYPEVLLDSSWMGVPILLVPKEKLLFQYMSSPKHGIMLPRIRLGEQRRPQ